MSKIKLIASDLDGTLLLNGSQSCDPKLYPLIEQLASNHVFFVAASGRQYHSLQRLFSPVKDKIMYLCENGALVMHNNKVQVKTHIEHTLALNICHEIINHPDCEVVASGERTCYLIPKSKEFVNHVRDDIGNHVTVIDYPEQIKEEIIKISYFVHPEKQKAATEQFFNKFSDTACIITVSGNSWVDFVSKGTGKGEALQQIGLKFGIKPEEMIAFGDNENDRTMLKFVGHPYLMETCNPTMKDISATYCKKVEDSLNEILKQL